MLSTIYNWPCRALVVAVAIISIAAFAYFFVNGMTNHYEEGVARVNAARRVVDSPDASLWQRYKQIGTEHLPLQTVLMIPLAASDWMWRTGFAGSIISIVSFVVAAVALYLLARAFYRKEEEPYNKQLPAISLAAFALNPSALFMQATPMSEILAVASLVLAIYLLTLWESEQSKKRLVIAAMAMTLATLAAYEAWLVAPFAILIVALAAQGDKQIKLKTTSLFAALVASGPILWLLHNWAVAGNAFEFISSASREARGAGIGWSKILAGNLLFDVFWMALTVTVIVGPYLMLLGATGFARSIIHKRRRLLEAAPATLLLVPIFFHIAGLFRGDFEIFPLAALPLVNVRYGLLHLPAIALFAPAAVLIFKGRGRRVALPVVCVLIAAQYGYLISEGPSQLAVYQEGYRNGVNSSVARGRARVTAWIKSSAPQPMILMSARELGVVIPRSGLRFSEVVSEGAERWNEMGDRLPADVRTVIIRRDDPVDNLLKRNPALALDLAESFQEEFAAGGVRVYRRR